MPPLTLEGDTLGQKHKHFNKLVQDEIKTKQCNLTKINYDDNDVDNLLRIDTANKTKNVDYILDVFKCDDMLYVSRAIKKCAWLITEQQYAHIVNPEYLDTQLFPHMLTRAINKLLLHIRLHLKDEKRVEGFYEHFKDTSEGQKWLLNCSLSFTENEIQKRCISLNVFERLCKRSVIFAKYYTRIESTQRNDWVTLRNILFLLKSNTEEFMNMMDDVKEYGLPSLNKKYTEVVMKKCPNRIIDNFEKYAGVVDFSMVAKYMKKNEIKDFLMKYADNENTKYRFSQYDILKHFIKNMPTEERFEFVKKLYIEKKETMAPKSHSNIVEMSCADSVCFPSCTMNPYQWYQYAPFNVAFPEIKKLIRAENSPNERTAMLSVLITCARKNSQHTKTLLQHYYDKHRNEPFKFKIQFVNNVISQMATHEFDSETWMILDNLFHSLEVYIESSKDVPMCLRTIILYRVLHNEKVPDIIEKKTSSLPYDTLKKSQFKLNKDQKNKIFSYLLTSISSQIQNKTISNQEDFKSAINLLTNAFNLLIDWKKDIKEYSFLHDKLQELLKIKKQNSWNSNELSYLYNMNKSWRRHMFEESMTLAPSEEVCLNALKHEPQLLARHGEEVHALRTDDAVSLRRLLAKLRVYWPHTLAQQWTDAYKESIKNTKSVTGNKAIIKGLFMLIPQKQMIKFAANHVPKDTKIQWSEIDQVELSICKNIAQNLYIARPPTPLNEVLSYAKGDYLQYTVPSLNAILHNTSKIQSRVYVSELLEAPVSLKKYGLHLAMKKLKNEELQQIFSDIWKTTKNSTIRTLLFTYTHNLLCKTKDETVAKDIWQLISIFIDNLTMNDSKVIFSHLGNAKDIPNCVQGQFYMKSYEFLKSLPPAANCENYMNNLINLAPNIMELLSVDFVTDKILISIEEKISKPQWEYKQIISSFILHGATEEEQCERFRKTLVPALEHATKMWDMVKDNEYVIKENVHQLMRTLVEDVKKFLCLKKIMVPVKLFFEITSYMQQKISEQENYVTLTNWKLLAEYVKLVAEYKEMLYNPKLDALAAKDYNNYLPEEAEEVWVSLHYAISPKLGPILVKYLKEDTEKYFYTIFSLFGEAIQKMFSHLSFPGESPLLDTLKCMIHDEDFVPCYLVVCQVTPNYGNEDAKKKRVELRKVLSAHPSLEVQMHFNKAFADIPDLVA